MCDVVHARKKKSFRYQATSGSNPYSQIPGSISATFWIELDGRLELKGIRRPVAAFNVTAPVADVPTRL